MNESIELIKKLTLAKGISGCEMNIKRIIGKEMHNFHSSETDNMGSVTYKFVGSSKPKIMFIAHQDEIGFIVSDITDDGFLQIQPIGGWDIHTLQSSPVSVINSQNATIHGLIGSVPVHFRRKNSQKLTMNKLFIDIGAKSAHDVSDNFKIELGAAVIPKTNFYYSETNQRIFSKAFDDRIGIAAMIELGKQLPGLNHPNTIYCTASVQEEVGTRGAIAISNYTDTDIAIVLEGAPADDIPGIEANPQTAVGKGVHIRIYDPRMLVKKSLKDFVIRIAKKSNINYQIAVRKAGGTDGKQLHTARNGIPTIVLGVPVRYAHSHTGVISLEDYEELKKLLIAIAENLDYDAAQIILS